MEITLQLDQMSTHEKLRLMEMIWENLSRNEGELESPAWHETVLRERQARLSSGEESPIDWEVAKRELRERHS